MGPADGWDQYPASLPAALAAAFGGLGVCSWRGAQGPSIKAQDGCFDGTLLPTRGGLSEDCLNFGTRPGYGNGKVQGCKKAEFSLQSISLYYLNNFEAAGDDTDMNWEVKLPGMRADIVFWDGDEWVIFETKVVSATPAGARATAQATAQAQGYVEAFEYLGIPARLGTARDFPQGGVGSAGSYAHGIGREYDYATGVGVIVATPVGTSRNPAREPWTVPSLGPWLVGVLAAAGATALGSSMGGGLPPNLIPVRPDR
jgi:hypothetical protein